MVKCLQKDCNKQPAYGIIGKKAEYCVNHKKIDMIDLKNKTCLQKDCIKIPNFGIIGKKAEYCVMHKKIDMINVVSKTCLQKDCNKQPSYGLLYGIKTHCYIHKSSNMCRISKPRCLESECTDYAIYGLQQSDTTFIIPDKCEKHKTENQKDIINFNCDWCDNKKIKYTEYYVYQTIKNIKPKYKYKTPSDVKICTECYHTRKNRGHKEDKIKDILNGIDHKYIHDKSIKGGCSNIGKRIDKDGVTRKNGSLRPDFLYEMSNFNIIIEVDENQHSSYGKLCINSIEKELCRTINLYNDSGGFPMAVIRYNPDKYKNKAGDTITEYTGRELILKKTIESIMKLDMLDNIIVVYYLFYDGFNGHIKSEPLKHEIKNKKLHIQHIHPEEPDKKDHVFDI